MDSKQLLQALKTDSLHRDTIDDPALRAMIEFADWLAFETELGKYPDEIEIVDQRAVHWPPARGTLPLTLLRYRVRDASGFEPDDVGIGLVGSTTFAMFSYQNHLRPPEDVYAIHCYWECVRTGIVVESEKFLPKQATAPSERVRLDVDDPIPLLRVHFPKPASNTTRRGDARGEEAILVAGERDGAKGWLVRDGERSIWYPAAEIPSEAPPKCVAMVHVGRVLLGLDVAGVDRAKHVNARFTLDDATFLRRYERALASARKTRGAAKKSALDTFGAIGRHSGRYVRLLAAKNRTEDVRAFIDELTPFWDHNAGYSELGKLAFDARLFDLASSFIEKLRRSYPDHHRSETMGILARIRASEGKKAEAIALLHECISRIENDRHCSPREVAFFSAPLRATLRDLEE